MVRTDDLHVGMCITVLSGKIPQKVMNAYGDAIEVESKSGWEGAPLIVEAIILPYALVRTPADAVIPIDTRMWSLAKVHKTYAKAYRDEWQRVHGEKKGRATRADFGKWIDAQMASACGGSQGKDGTL